MAIGLNAQSMIAPAQGGELKKSRRVSYSDDVFTNSTIKAIGAKNPCTSPPCNSPNETLNQNVINKSTVSNQGGNLLEVRRMSKKRQMQLKEDITDL